MLVIKTTLAVLSVLVVLKTAISFVHSRAWWVRIFDFPRPQIAASSVILLALFGLTNLGFEEAGLWEWMLFILLGASVTVQVSQMLPYTRLWKRQVPTAPADFPKENRLRIVISNVCMKSRQIERWLNTVRAEAPHLIFAVEVDDWWCRELSVLDPEYPHQIRQPQNNTYGVAVYSSLPLHHTKIKHLIEADVPSIFTSLELPSGNHVRCVVLHPRPPRPDIQQDSDLRDAELVRAGQIIRSFRSPAIVAGDLNDVAWSHTTHLFQRIACMLDPRIGRGLFATFHADHWFLRYPLDHVFHSNHFDLVELRRLKHVGSDHFPILIELALRSDQVDRPEVDPMDESDEEQAIDAVQDASDLRENETRKERHERQRTDR